MTLPDAWFAAARSSSRLFYRLLLVSCLCHNYQTYRTFFRIRCQSPRLNRCRLRPTTPRLNSPLASIPTLAVCTVVVIDPLSSSIHEVVLAGQAALLCGVPGNDVMVQLTNPAGKNGAPALQRARRRRGARPVHLVDHDGPRGPGQRVGPHAQPGDDVDIVGPRGKIVLDPRPTGTCSWATSRASVRRYRMGQSIEAPGRAVFIVETDHADDALTATFDEGIGVTGIFVDRMGPAPRTIPPVS